MDSGIAPTQRRVGTASMVALGLLLFGCATGRNRPEATSCDLVSARAVQRRFEVSDVTVKVKKRSCEFTEKGSASPFLIVSKMDVDGTPLSALVAGDAVPGFGDEAVASDRGGPLGSAVVVRSGSSAVRVDAMPAGSVAADRIREVALGLAAKSARALGGRRGPSPDSPTSACDRFSSIESLSDGSALLYRPINDLTCEARVDGRAGSVYASVVTPTGATPDDLSRSAGPDAVPVEVADAARWTPSAGDRGGSLWVLAGGGLYQFNALDLGASDQGSGIAAELARAFVAGGS